MSRNRRRRASCLGTIMLVLYGILATIAIFAILDKQNNPVKESPRTEDVVHIFTMEPEPTPTPKPSLDDDVEQENYTKLTAELGTVEGPAGRETYYNLPMGGVVSIMRDLGYDEIDYPYWIRYDGVKMFGPYIMCAADLELRPRGTLIMSTLGMCIVCDTGEFIYENPTQLDIAVNW